MDEFVMGAKMPMPPEQTGSISNLATAILAHRSSAPTTPQMEIRRIVGQPQSLRLDLYERIQKEVNGQKLYRRFRKYPSGKLPPAGWHRWTDSPIIDLTEPIALLKGLEERGASYFVQSAGSPSITISLTQVDKTCLISSNCTRYFAKN